MEVDHLNVTISYHVYEYRISRGLTVRGLSDQTLQHVHDELNTHHSHSVKKILHDIEMEQHRRSEN